MRGDYVMIVCCVPPEHSDAVLSAIGAAGAGVAGEYTHCAYTSEGVGRFRPSARANPAYGTREQDNHEPETRIETFCLRVDAKTIVQALRQAHPYEEPVIYVIPLLDEDSL